MTLPSVTRFRACRRCAIRYPLQPQYFYRDRGNREGFRPVCKVCAELERKDYRARLGLPKRPEPTKKTCPVCHAEFKVTKREQAQLYCCRACYYEAIKLGIDPRRKDKDRPCKQCGTVFRQKTARNYFCCNSCANSWTNNPSTRGQGAVWIGVCEWCGESYSRRVKTRKYCSQKCAGKALAGDLSIKTCPKCERTLPATGDYFSQPPSSKSPRGIANYCRDCARFERLNQPHKYGVTRTKDVVRMYEDQGGLCAYCEISLDGVYHVDHMIPVSRGGEHSIMNFAITCARCNMRKQSRTAEEFWEILCRT